MDFLNFKGYSLWINIAVFVVAAAVVWLAGARLSRYATTISDRTGIGKAFIGLVLLGGITSLPEVATSITASWSGNAALAVNNLLGGVAMQVAVLVLADAAIGRDALTSVIARPGVLLQGALGVLLLVLVIAGITVGEVPVFGVGGWSVGILVLYFLSVWLIAQYGARETWAAADRREAPGRAEKQGSRKRKDGEHRQGENADDSGRGAESPSLGRTVLKTVIAGLAILIAGFLVARTGDAIAAKTGLGSSFVGAVFVAIATSLPEISTVLSAMRLRQYEMAISDIFGTNLFDLVLIFVVDVVYVGGLVLDEVGRFSSFAALLGIAVTTIYIVGLIERKDRTMLRMGGDSVAVLGVYIGGLVILYTLR
ncbi:sodium:calcium antiporter [Rhodospirillaceae bacterium SYSU D60014]|uniref:sodium:calcium antiporter n=1 Tax=Virgifigura deserti TaxID=2268457 RepID=UPI000E67322F